MQNRTTGPEHLFKQCQEVFSTQGRCSTARCLLRDKGQYLQFCKLSEQFFNAHIKVQEEIDQTDYLIAQATISKKFKIFLLNVRERKN